MIRAAEFPCPLFATVISCTLVLVAPSGAYAQRAGEVMVPSSHVVSGPVQPQKARLVRVTEKPGSEVVGFYGMARRKTSIDPVTYSNPAQADPNWDPLAGPNQIGYQINRGLNVAIEQPVVKGYRAVTTKPIRKSIRNFISNIGTPVSIVNQVAQGKTNSAGVDTTRFLVNSTLGLVGIFDVADEVYGIKPVPREDFGQTLAKYGTPAGPPLDVPVLGQTNPRDLAGFVTDMMLAPRVTPGADSVSTFGPAIGIASRIAVLDAAGPTAAFPEPSRKGQTPYEARRELSVQRRNSEIRR